MSMDNTPTPEHTLSNTKKKIITFGGLLLIALCFLSSYFITPYYKLNVSLSDAPPTDGPGIATLLMTDELDEKDRPIGDKRTFTARDKIIGWVELDEPLPPLGFRWYYGTELVFEQFGEPSSNPSYTYIGGSPSSILPAGDYRLEIYLAEETPAELLDFTVEKHKPVVSPPMHPPPEGHLDIERSVYTEIPFIYDETWIVEGVPQLIHEVKILLMESPEIDIVVLVEEDPSEMPQQLAEETMRAIAFYAMDNGYLKIAENIQVDGDDLTYTHMTVYLYHPETTAWINMRFGD